MQIDTSTMIPWKSNDLNENLLVDFLNQSCFWKGPFDYGNKEDFFIAYSEFCRLRGTTSESRGMTETRLQRLGHEVSRNGVRGIFVRTGSEVPAPGVSDSPKLPAGNAAVSTPHELPILPTDDPLVRKQKEDYNSTLQPEPPKEVIFVSAKPAM